MHLITGLALSFLASRRLGHKASTGAASPLLRLRSPVETVHVIPGRVRFRVPAIVSSTDNAQLVVDTLGKLEAVEHVEASSITGSVLIRYRAGDLSPELLFAALVRILGLEKELEKAPQAAVVREAQDVGRCVNRSLYDKTGGIMDLRGALLVLLLFVGVRKILLERGRALPPGATLLWWAASLIQVF